MWVSKMELCMKISENGLAHKSWPWLYGMHSLTSRQSSYTQNALIRSENQSQANPSKIHTRRTQLDIPANSIPNLTLLCDLTYISVSNKNHRRYRSIA